MELIEPPEKKGTHNPKILTRLNGWNLYRQKIGTDNLNIGVRFPVIGDSHSVFDLGVNLPFN